MLLQIKLLFYCVEHVVYVLSVYVVTNVVNVAFKIEIVPHKNWGKYEVVLDLRIFVVVDSICFTCYWFVTSAYRDEFVF